MKNALKKFWREEDGVMTFEWVTLVSLLTIGVVGGVAVARDAVIDELADVAEAMVSLDQSYTIDFPLAVYVNAAPGVQIQEYNAPFVVRRHTTASTSSASNSSYTDHQPEIDRERMREEAAGAEAAEVPRENSL